ncbi:hypothetical protein PsorP6_011929 [Peronosclerospora sorghi]|uniref:Uncharacterized protein n=1 Tax=Peronosclerospora sorghi TaxID=230839 RepID=A0ACC0WKW7_9STRA|nr:hypothetical protein PsorP6_011929 [Peronosclerospora sorghi]
MSAEDSVQYLRAMEALRGYYPPHELESLFAMEESEELKQFLAAYKTFYNAQDTSTLGFDKFTIKERM